MSYGQTSSGSIPIVGNGVPGAGVGTTNDAYIDDLTGDYYIKLAGTWTLEGNIRGGAGGTGITTLNTLIAATQTFATGTAGSNFSISSSGSTHTFNLPTASASNRGLLSSADWTIFNNKLSALSFPILAPDSTALSPSYGFSDEPGNDMGMFRPAGLNQIGWSVQGNQVMTLDGGGLTITGNFAAANFIAAANAPTGGTTGKVLTKVSGADYDFSWQPVVPVYPLIASSGSAGAPSYAFSETGNDTGLYSQGDGDLSFSTNGSIAMNIDGSKNLTVVGNIAAANYPPTGTNSTFAGFDGTGALESVPGFQINTTSGGMDSALTAQPNGIAGGFSVHNQALDIDPLQNSPDEVWNLNNWNVNLDPNSSGFTFGTNGAATTLLNLGFNHQGTGDVGGLTFFSQSMNLGNGTDPINVKGLSYMYGFGAINANVNVNGSVQGYGFQPSFNAASTCTGSFNAFYDFATAPITVSGWNGFTTSPNIAAIANNTNYNGFSSNPNITTFNGNAGYFGLNLSPNITTMNAGGFFGININPTVGSCTNATGLNINMGNVTGTNVKAIDVTGDVAINGALSFTGALAMGQLSANYASNPIDGGGNPQNMHGLITSMTALNGTTVANADAIGVNTAMLMQLEDNSVTTSGPFKLGFAALALPCVVETHIGSTLDFMNAAAFAINLVGSSTGGTIDNVNLCRAVAIPNGITTINKLKAFEFDLPFGDPGSTTWGVYMEPAVHNWMKQDLKIGGTAGSTDTAAVGVALHVEGSSMFDGSIGFFNTAPVAQQTGGVATAGGTYTATEQTMLQVVYDALRTYGLLT